MGKTDGISRLSDELEDGFTVYAETVVNQERLQSDCAL